MKYLCLLLICLFINTRTVSQSRVSILKKAENYLKPWSRYQFDADLHQLNGQHSISHVFVSQGNVLMATKEPMARRGDVLLLLDSATYIRPKQTQTSIRISANGRLARPLYYADLLTLDWQHNYRIQKSRLDKTTRYFVLLAKTAATPYARVELWVDIKTSKPIRSKIYLPSKALFKILTFDKVKQIQERTILTQVKFINANNKEEATILLKNIVPNTKISEIYFNPIKLGEVSKLMEINKD